MKTNMMFTYRSLNAIATIFLVVAFVVALGVIPFVKFDTFPGATPENALPAFWAFVFFEFIIGTILMFKAYYFTERNHLLSAFLAVVAAIELLLTLVFIDAAIAYWSHGAAMHVASIVLLSCSLANLLSVILIVRAIVLIPKPN